MDDAEELASCSGRCRLYRLLFRSRSARRRLPQLSGRIGAARVFGAPGSASGAVSGVGVTYSGELGGGVINGTAESGRPTVHL